MILLYVVLECMMSRPLVTVWYRLIFDRNGYCVNVQCSFSHDIHWQFDATNSVWIDTQNDDDIDDNKCEWENESKWPELDKITLITFYWYECEVWKRSLRDIISIYFVILTAVNRWTFHFFFFFSIALQFDFYQLHSILWCIECTSYITWTLNKPLSSLPLQIQLTLIK